MNCHMMLLAAACWAGFASSAVAVWPGGPKGTRDLAPPAADDPSSPPQRAVPSGPANTPRYEQENSLGYPRGEDPFFNAPMRPAWDVQSLEPKHWDRPTYVRPQANDLPVYRQEPWDRPVIERPDVTKPFADDKPRYTVDYYQAPGDEKPTMANQAPTGPNYDERPYTRPGYNAPAYDAPIRERIDDTPPTYSPQEYQPPRELPPPYMAPAR